MLFFDYSGLDPKLSESINAELHQEHIQVDRIEEADIILCGINPLKIEKSWACKYVICPCTNTNHITLPSNFYRLPQIAIYNLQNVKDKIKNVHATAHHTIYLMLNAVWNQSFKPSSYMQFKRPILPRRSLVGMRLGLIGYGRIGREVERIAHTLGMKTDWIDKEFESCTKHELLTQSDIISLHTTIEPDQKPILGKEELALVKDGAIIINTSRGEAIDESTLKDQMPRLGYFAADTLCGEPTPKALENFLSYSNCLITPHIGGFVFKDLRQTSKLVYDFFKEEIKNESNNV